MKTPFKIFLALLGLTLAWWFVYPKYDAWQNARLVRESDNASVECEFPWENARVLRQATTAYENSVIESGMSIVYYEQVIGTKRYKSLALYRGPKHSWATCEEKFQGRYANRVDIGDDDYPYAIIVSDGAVTMQLTKDKKRAPPLEKLPIIGGPKPFCVEDKEDATDACEKAEKR